MVTSARFASSASTGLRIAQRAIGAGEPCLIVAEVAQAHDGSLGCAHAYVDASAAAGADAVKFQVHIAAAESTAREPWRIRFSAQDESRFDYWRRMEFTPEQWLGLAQRCRDRGVLFLASPFSFEAVELLERIGVPAWKVASGELDNLPMIRRMASTGKPVILSSGLSSWAELDQAVGEARRCAAGFALLQCTTAYPTPPERVGLNLLAELRERYRAPVGLSDHSGTTAIGIAAATLGACILEVHVAFSRQAFGPDVPASLTIEELGEMVRGVRFVERALARPVDKDAAAAGGAELRRTFGKSIVAARCLPAGHRLAQQDLALKKPGDGLRPARLWDVVGRTLQRELAADEALREEDLG